MGEYTHTHTHTHTHTSNLKNNKGITLIALVVTVIVLLILAGVSISMLSGDNGIITKASEAKINTDLAQIDESLKLYELSQYTATNTSDTILIDNKMVQKIYVKDTMRTIWLVKDFDNLDISSDTGKGASEVDEDTTEIETITDLNDVYVIDKTDDKLYYVSGKETYCINGENNLKNFKYEVVEANPDDWKTKENSDGTITLTEYIGNAKDIVVPNFYDGKRVKMLYNEAASWPKNIFSSGSNISSIIISGGIEELGQGAFCGLSKITEINIPDSVTVIGVDAFYSCSSLETINIPENVKSIGGRVFYNTISLTNIILDRKNENFVMEDGILYNKEKTRIIRCLPSSTIEEYTISSNITTLDRNAFMNCKNLKSIFISGSIKIIDNDVFSGCSNLSNVTIEEGITQISQTAFNNTKSLENIQLPDTLTKISDTVFSYSGLKSISIPSSVTNIGRNVFSGCPLTEIYISIEDSEKISIASSAFSNLSKSSVIYVKNTEMEELLKKQASYINGNITIELYE